MICSNDYSRADSMYVCMFDTARHKASQTYKYKKVNISSKHFGKVQMNMKIT